MVQALRHELALTGAGRPAREDLASALAPALAPRFSLVAQGRPETVRRTWLDTFDWRLHRAGLTLVDEVGRGGRRVAVVGADGETAAGAGPPRWPCLARELPEGPLRSVMAPLAGVRTLLPVVRTVSVVRRLRACDADAKTVAWLTAEQTTVSGARGAGPAVRLTVAAVRGYQGEADRIRQRLVAANLAEPAPPPLTAALAAVGRRPQDYTGKLDVALVGDAPATTAMTALLRRLLDMLEANVQGTVRDLDTEFLHDLRVAVRRTRSALKIGATALPEHLAGRFRPEFKWLGDATTPTRDLDVYLLDFASMANQLVAASPADLDPLHAHLRQRRAARQRELARLLRSARFTGLTGAWRAALAEVTPAKRGPATARFAAGRVGALRRRVLAEGGAITPSSPPEALHDLRKRCKELRYALEFFASLHDPAAQRKVVAHLKGLQDCLGEFQDRQVQRLELEMFATQMMREREVPARALLAMGDLAAQLALRQRAAREEFAGQFADFAGREVRRHFRELSGGAE